MAGRSGAYKSYARGARTFTTESDFKLGMSDTLGALPDGYLKTLINFDIINNGENLQPRPGLRTSKFFVPNIAAEATETEYHGAGSGYILRTAHEEQEIDGKTHYQFIVARCNKDDNEGTLYVATGQDALDSIARDAVPQKISIAKDIPDDNMRLGATVLNTLDPLHPVKAGCLFDKPKEASIHGITMAVDGEDADLNESIASIVGTWGSGSQFFFLTNDKAEIVGEDEETWPHINIYYTKFNEVSGLYEINAVPMKRPTASEAGTFGLNMLLDDPEEFLDLADSQTTDCDLHGIMIYNENDHIELYPRKNRSYKMRVNYNISPGTTNWLIKMSWREGSDVTWNHIHSKYINMSGVADGASLPLVQKSMVFPSKDVFIRAEAYKQITDLTGLDAGIDYFVYDGKYFELITTSSTLVGFYLDRQVERSMENSEMVNYNLRTAAVMGYWEGRVFLSGVAQDPKVLFLSDMNNPGYFPYPTNAVDFDYPVVKAVPHLNGLMVYTTRTAVLLTLNADGLSWTKTTVQKDLYISPWDRHLIQPVKNMQFLKSGNYYYMIVPKATSLTGELSLAPVSAPVTDFLDRFETRLFEYLDIMYPALKQQNLHDVIKLVNYYNYLDYEDIHNVYVFRYETHFLHVDLQYNYVSRTWKMYVYEGQDMLMPYKHDATQRGELMASTFIENLSVKSFTEMNCVVDDDGYEAVFTNKIKLRDTALDIRHARSLRWKATGTVKAGLSAEVLGEVFTTKTYDAQHNRMIFTSSGNKQLIVPLTANDTSGVWLVSPSFNIPMSSKWTLEESYGGEWIALTSGDTKWPIYKQSYGFLLDEVLVAGDTVKVADKSYVLDSVVNGELRDTTRTGEDLLMKYIGPKNGKHLYHFYFSRAFDGVPAIKTYQTTTASGGLAAGRCIQFFKYNPRTKQDYYVPTNWTIDCPGDITAMTPAEKVEAFSLLAKTLSSLIEASVDAVEESITFKNWQYLDTGNRDQALENNKRYRELQMFINNTGGADLDFGLQFILDDQERSTLYTYEVQQVTDTDNPNYGLLYIEPSPVYNVDVPGVTALGAWSLDNTRFPEISLWKIRSMLQGKGYAPRMRLVSRNQTDFTIMSYTWVYRMMYLR